MTVEIKQPNGKTDVVTINKFEEIIGKTLPDDYRNFLLTFNGGKPESNEFEIPDERNAAGVNLFYGILGKLEWGDLLFQRKALLDRIPHDVLPIGEASMGNAVCVSLQAATFGKVFFWDHEAEAGEGEIATFSNLHLVGDSFEDFFAKLKQFDINQVRLKPGQVKKSWINPDFLKLLKEKK